MKVEDTVMSDDDIDGTRFHILDELEKKAKVNWWDICKAVEETRGKQASLDAEQFLIDITNKTGQEIAKAQAEITWEKATESLDLTSETQYKAGIKEVVEWIQSHFVAIKDKEEWQSKLKEWGI